MENLIPKPLRSQLDVLLATKLPFIHIEPFTTDEVLDPWTSKYLGVPYLPKDIQYPLGTNGEPLISLAQLNFSEMPNLENYPSKGILQFFIAANDLYGLEYTNPYDPTEQFQLQQQQRNFRVIYYPEIIKNLDALTTSVDFLPEFEYSPIFEGCKLEFSLREDFVGIDDYRFEKVLGEDFLNSLSEEEREEIFDSSTIRCDGNKVGGYAFFTQDDVRLLAPPTENWLLLLQIDSAPHADIMWGDAGVGNFFIEEQALKALDFSRVLYNWDCA